MKLITCAKDSTGFFALRKKRIMISITSIEFLDIYNIPIKDHNRHFTSWVTCHPSKSNSNPNQYKALKSATSKSTLKSILSNWKWLKENCGYYWDKNNLIGVKSKYIITRYKVVKEGYEYIIFESDDNDKPFFEKANSRIRIRYKEY